ncbi:glutathione ABC superfamily ATP binding cassette transporter, ABC protein [Candidatus Endolissoclinum faulkneri L5]|uniref:Glutathione ABC superfamily ATP binding cassette transporter, ABC protein n=1 Tax=Candidatus Endolissoclinum faulkneri L5 TaxID=1401328 RepID=V9TS64_9PROT|nr:ABC transporter ATP-binding protein [Candidatus Endolissoclinum faulkneri]AHC73426.1 glutathione ABC superfamily ATP binding cassette transporter, ABC protein [Candidatus Endolissoclinum faulkneri L5]
MTDESKIQPILEIKNLTVDLPNDSDRIHAIEEISIYVDPCEILCLVGESGSGKSVTAFSVMGLLPKDQLTPSSGTIDLMGENLLEVSAKRLRELRGARMSMIFQEPMTALNPTMTCGDQINEVLVTHTSMNYAMRRAKVINILGQMQLTDLSSIADSYPHQLSGGQRQRIMIAMALVLDPVLLIADEPTTALDVTTQEQILRLIKEIQHNHETAVLFITHDFGVVAEIADRVVVMQAGRVIEQGPAKLVLKQPNSPYTKMLISSVPNFVSHCRPLTKNAPIVLATKNLCKTYVRRGLFQKTREIRAAHSVNLEIRRGATLGIVGESGSGKSTVARCIARLIDPTSGHIYLESYDIAQVSQNSLRALRSRVQIIFQDPYRSLNPRRTVGASIIEGLVNYGMSKKEAYNRACLLMPLVRIDPDVLNRFPHQFSGGQRQRICIARALAMEPDLIIADEAVSALDVSVQSQVLELLDDVRRRLNLAVLFITHDLRVAAQVCDTVAVMHRGEVVEYGEATRVFDNPQHEYTRALFAAAPGRGFDFANVSIST